MDKIKDIILQLDENESNWRTYIKMNDDSQTSDVDGFRRQIVDLLLALRELMKKEKQREIDAVRELIHDDNLSDTFLKNVQATLIHYKALQPVRQLEKENLLLCKDFFQDIMANYVVRWDRSLHLSFEKYRFANSADMKNAMESIDSLTDYYVGNTFVHESIVKDFSDETGLSQEICRLYGQLVDTYYKEIKMNMIMNHIDSLMERTKKIEDAVLKGQE